MDVDRQPDPTGDIRAVGIVAYHHRSPPGVSPAAAQMTGCFMALRIIDHICPTIMYVT
jgi:hypothetical protein